MQTKLESTGISERNKTILRNDYSKTEEYSDTHKDTISDGDPLGKGSGEGGHSHIRPGNDFVTDPSRVGGSYDINGRNGNGGRTFLLNINTYGSNYEYSENLINTELNQQDGQVVID